MNTILSRKVTDGTILGQKTTHYNILGRKHPNPINRMHLINEEVHEAEKEHKSPLEKLHHVRQRIR